MDGKHHIIGIHVTDRVQRAGEVQKILSEYGTYIRTRIGLHHVNHEKCSPNGLILVEVLGDDRLCDEMRTRLGAIEGVEVKEMVFDHPE